MDKFRLTEQDRATLQYRVTTKLREVILKGEFKVGDRLIQEEWADKLGVSRMPIREALRQLEVEGLVRIEPRRGAIVTPISVEDIEEIYQLRALLEGQAVEKSLPFLEEEEIKELENLYERMIELNGDEKDVEEYMQLNARFHQVLREGCPWRRIHGLIEALWKGIPPYTPSLLSNHLQEAHQEHFIMLEYVKQKKPKELREVMEKHILRTRDNLIQFIDKSGNQS
ncbi:GntR family transcriptional regulator [Halalkalibacter nanhaiisediminis]|uniref:DNA-binding GntR family transcriptional regulator n=1 Tax=Halalkalibacter nanhaiisediminis TaxID=688079 RepID=A0A562QFD8_9BACI|nr:GntR family transcriptional regulator [Halalkalibacter nanhaiisediminis]TWI54746.1 DNA-binding GntR family transcriptional regulator [Halalkalibacter nanhaiisediminis]